MRFWTESPTVGVSAWVAVEAGEPKLLASFPCAEVEIPWIRPGKSYVFTLHAGEQPSSTLLDTPTIEGG